MRAPGECGLPSPGGQHHQHVPPWIASVIASSCSGHSFDQRNTRPRPAATGRYVLTCPASQDPVRLPTRRRRQCALGCPPKPSDALTDRPRSALPDRPPQGCPWRCRRLTSTRRTLGAPQREVPQGYPAEPQLAPLTRRAVPSTNRLRGNHSPARAAGSSGEADQLFLVARACPTS